MDEVHFEWSSQFYEPADGLPYIGALPGHKENVYVACGFGGNGMIYSHVAAAVLHDIILEKENPLINLFAPGRIKPVAGFTNFIRHNADVVRQFIGKWFGSEKIEQIAELAKGEARVVNYEGHAIALFKDESGKLHALSPACTHMKCSVAWNNSERSWDCPCHGARYNVDGKVITGPASFDLEKIELRDEAEDA